MTKTADMHYGRRGGGWLDGAEPVANRLADFRQYRMSVVKKSPDEWPEGQAGEDGWGMARHREIADEVAALQAAGYPVPPAYWASVDLVKEHDKATKKAKPRKRRKAAA